MTMPRALLLTLAIAGVVALAVLLAMTVVVSVGPLQGLTLDQKLALMGVIVAAAGFPLTILALMLAYLGVMGSIERPELSLLLMSRPSGTDGNISWHASWIAVNESTVVCQWFSVQLRLFEAVPRGTMAMMGVEEPATRFQLTTSPIESPAGGSWSGSRADATGVLELPAMYQFHSGGEVGLFQAGDVMIGGPSLYFNLQRRLAIEVVISAPNAKARNYQLFVDTTGAIIADPPSVLRLLS